MLNRSRSIGLLAALLLLVASSLLASADAQQLNEAGLVIRHDDGTLIYAYVQFEEDEISGSELLQRAGIETAVTPFGGLGTGVCSINGEGCSADNCYCHSYQSPAYWWHYYTWEAGDWQISLKGPTDRMLHDGDIDGWSWTAGEPQLPEVTIDEIAAMNSVAAAPTATTVASPTPSIQSTEESEQSTRAAAAVIVTPSASPTPLQPAPGSESSNSNLLLFGIVTGAIVTAGGAALIYRQRRVS